MKKIKGIKRICPKFYKDVKKVIKNAEKMPDVKKLVAFGCTLDEEEEYLSPDDDLLIAAYLDDVKTYTEDELYELSDKLEEKTCVYYEFPRVCK